MYAYKCLTGDGLGKTVCKVRGTILNSDASKNVNFDVIRDMILKGKSGPFVVNVHSDNKIKRKRRGRNSIYYQLT